MEADAPMLQRFGKPAVRLRALRRFYIIQVEYEWVGAFSL